MVGVDMTAEGEIDLSFGWHFRFGLKASYALNVAGNPSLNLSRVRKCTYQSTK